MASQLTRRSILCRMTRQFYCNSNNKTKSMSTSTPKIDSKPDDVHSIGTIMHPVSDFDKRILVWVKRYPSMAEVPSQVTRDCMAQARSKARIRTCNIMMLVTLIGFIIAVFSGKKDLAAGKTLFQRRKEWYEGLQKEHAAEIAATEATADQK